MLTAPCRTSPSCGQKHLPTPVHCKLPVIADTEFYSAIYSLFFVVVALGLRCCTRAFSSCSPWVIPTVVTVSFDGQLVNSSRKPSWVCKGRKHTSSVGCTPGKAEGGCEYPAWSCRTQRRHRSGGIPQGTSRKQECIQKRWESLGLPSSAGGGFISQVG